MRVRRLLTRGAIGVVLTARCGGDDPVVPIIPQPQVSFVRQATLRGKFATSNDEGAWSPSGRRFAYQRWNGVNYDLLVYDATQASSLPIKIYAGDLSRVITWSPASDWVLCMSQAPADYTTELYSLVAFPVQTGAMPRVVLARTEVNWGVWGANGRIYWWDIQDVQRRSLAPPVEWASSNPGPFPDRTDLVFLVDRQAPPILRGRHHWFQNSPEAEGTFDYQNPGQLGPILIATNVFADGQRFVVFLPMYDCPENAIVDREGRVLTRFFPCEDPPFLPWAATADGRYVIGLCERDDSSGDLLSVTLYAANVEAT